MDGMKRSVRTLLGMALCAVVILLVLPVDMGRHTAPLAVAVQAEMDRQGGMTPGPALIGLFLSMAAVLACLSPSARSLAFLVLLANIGAMSLWFTRSYDTMPGRPWALGVAVVGIVCGAVLALVGRGGVGIPRWIGAFGLGVVAFGLVSLAVYKAAALGGEAVEIGAPLRFIAVSPDGVRWSLSRMLANAGVWGIVSAVLTVAWAMVLAGSGRIRIS
jgi:hypothetical protein